MTKEKITKKMNIQKAKEKDLKKIKEIFLAGAIDETRLQYPKKSLKKIEKDLKEEMKNIFKEYKKEIKSPKSYWIIVKEKEKIIAFANAVIKRKNEGWLEFNYVDKAYRRKGIGKKLTIKRIDWLKNKEIKSFYSKTFIKNNKSLDNLKKFGFKPVMLKVEKIIK